MKITIQLATNSGDVWDSSLKITIPVPEDLNTKDVQHLPGYLASKVRSAYDSIRTIKENKSSPTGYKITIPKDMSKTRVLIFDEEELKVIKKVITRLGFRSL